MAVLQNDGNSPEERDILITSVSNGNIAVTSESDPVHMTLVHSSSRLYVLNPLRQVQMLLMVAAESLYRNCMVMTSQLKLCCQVYLWWFVLCHGRNLQTGLEGRLVRR